MIKDTELLQLLRTEPDRGLNTLMDQYMALVYTIVRGRLAGSLPEEDVEECVSDVFYQFYKKLATVDLKKGTVKTYLSVMARHRAIDCYRRNQLRNANEQRLTEAQWEFAPALTGGAEETVFNQETRRQLIAEILAMGEPDSEIFIRKYYFGQSTKEIAAVIEMKANTVDKRVERGLKKLKLAMGGAV